MWLGDGGGGCNAKCDYHVREAKGYYVLWLSCEGSKGVLCLVTIMWGKQRGIMSCDYHVRGAKGYYVLWLSCEGSEGVLCLVTIMWGEQRGIMSCDYHVREAKGYYVLWLSCEGNEGVLCLVTIMWGERRGITSCCYYVGGKGSLIACYYYVGGRGSYALRNMTIVRQVEKGSYVIWLSFQWGGGMVMPYYYHFQWRGKGSLQ